MIVPDTTALEPGTVIQDPHGHSFTMKAMPCPICGPGLTDVVGWRGGRYHRFGHGIETRIVRCRSCRLLYPDPFPEPADVEGLYGAPETYFAGHDVQTKIANCRKLIQALKQRQPLEDASLLDVGCGCGELLHAAAMEGVKRAVGLDMSSAMVTVARETYGVDARVQTIESFAEAPPQVFEIVTLCGILEHVHDPDIFVASLAKLTKPGSWLFIDIPQEPNLLTMIGNTWSRLRRSDAVYNLSPTWLPFHVFGYSVYTLQVLLAKHGFAIREHQAWADPVLPGAKSPWGQFQAFVGTQINRVANLTGTAHNMYVWAQRL